MERRAWIAVLFVVAFAGMASPDVAADAPVLEGTLTGPVPVIKVTHRYDANGNLITDATRGIDSIRYNVLNLPETIYFSNGYRLSYIYLADGTKLRETRRRPTFSVGAGSAGVITETTDYIGAYEYENGVPRRLNLPGGYLTLADSVYHHYIPDYQGNILAVVNTRTRQIEQRTNYYPYGMPHGNATGAGLNKRKYSGKELITFAGYDAMDYHARWRPTSLPLFTTPDPLSEKRQDVSIYTYCSGDPVNRIDEDGEAWRPIVNQDSGEFTGFEWVPSEDSYDDDGRLLPGLYEQAIFFSEGGTKGEFDSNEGYNIGTSIAYIYLANGSMCRFDACTYPSDRQEYATIPAGRYEAKVGSHKSSYQALRISDVGTTNFSANQIKLSEPNPYNGEYRIVGANIHKPGKRNLTGKTSSGKPISKACILIDINKWDKFISIFNTESQIDNIIGIIISRNLMLPEDLNMEYYKD